MVSLKSVPFYRPEPLGPQHEDMKFYLSGKNIFGPKGPIIEVEYRQKILEIASERDNDLLEWRNLPSQISFRLKQPNINVIIKRIKKERFRRG